MPNTRDDASENAMELRGRYVFLLVFAAFIFVAADAGRSHALAAVGAANPQRPSTRTEQPASTTSPSGQSALPRPIGVPEDASPEDKGREILRVAIELVRHGNLHDTVFASDLLRLQVGPEKGLPLVDNEHFPQHLASMNYNLTNVGPIPESVRFHLSPQVVCTRLGDFLEAFKREFGIGTDIIVDSPREAHTRPRPEQGWSERLQIHPSNRQPLIQVMPSGLVVDADFDRYGQCAISITVERFRFSN